MVNIFEKTNELLVRKVYAQSLGSTITDSLKDTSTSTVDDMIGRVVKIAVPVAVISAFILLSYGGYLLISSQGNPDKLQEAKSVITNAIIGLLVIVLSVAILLIISNTLNLGAFT